jgi:uncharacterized protein YdhG (YjbR/CyaY superfamily)
MTGSVDHKRTLMHKQGDERTPERVALESIVHPGKTKIVDAGMYFAMRDALLEILPAQAPGLTREEILEAVPARLPAELYPGGAKVGWWSKAVQLDLEAKGVIARESSRPLRWHRDPAKPSDRWKATDRQVNRMATKATAGSIDQYIAGFPPETQTVLRDVRALIKASAPAATETISYAMPTFDLNGHHLVHFAGYEKHIGFYPVPSGIEAFAEELRPYKRGKGSVQLPLGQPLPTDLIRRIVEFRVAETTGKGSGKAPPT